MANFFQSGSKNEPMDLNQLKEATGMLTHLATLETEKQTYMALGDVRPFQNGAQISVLLVKETVDENGEKTYEIVRDLKELHDIVPRIIQAFAPDAEINMSNMPVIDEEEEMIDEDMPFVFDCSGNDEFVS